jgi:hypothetical protein
VQDRGHGAADQAQMHACIAGAGDAGMCWSRLTKRT